jgi:two-component system nitrogen regulation response regulator GlnG
MRELSTNPINKNDQGIRMTTLLVVDDEPAIIDFFCRVFANRDVDIVAADSAAAGLQIMEQQRPDAVMLDIVLPDGSGLDVFRQIREMDVKVPIVVMTSHGGSDTAIRAMQLGALDYLTKPLDVRELIALVDLALEICRLMNEPVQVDPATPEEARPGALVGRGSAMQRVYKAIGQVAAQNVTVLVRGESGTGKELIARALYQYSDRAEKPFLAVNCAAIPEMLLESELFGHEKGAFTGADKKRIGRFEQCHGGTLFLDEIGDMDALLQSKLLRVLQEQTFERVGGNETIKTDVRVIAATNRNLEEMVAAHDFREDLFYRLNGFMIQLPPLRDRGEDFDLLLEHFRCLSNLELNKNVQRFAPDAIRLLRECDWPGNVRQLQSVVRQGIIQSSGPVLLAEFLPELSAEQEQPIACGRGGTGSDAIDRLVESGLTNNSATMYDDVVGEVERRLINRVLNHTSGNQTEAAKLLGISRTTIRAKMDKLGLAIEHTAHAESREEE